MHKGLKNGTVASLSGISYERIRLAGLHDPCAGQLLQVFVIKTRYRALWTTTISCPPAA